MGILWISGGWHYYVSISQGRRKRVPEPFHLSMLTGLFKSTIRYWGFNWWAENVNHCQGLSQVTGKHWLIIAIDDISHTGQYNFNWMLYWVKRVHTNFSLMFDLQCNYMLFFLWLWLIGLFVSFSPDFVTSCSDELLSKRTMWSINHLQPWISQILTPHISLSMK